MDIKQPCYLFFDYDNTVLVDNKIADETNLAMEYARSLGHKLILCTGRSRGHLSRIPELSTIPWDGMIFGGADIFYNTFCLEEHISPRKDLLQWVKYSMRHRYRLILEGQYNLNDFRFENHPQPYTWQEKRELFQYIKQLTRTNPITKFSIFGANLDLSDCPKTRMNYVVHPHYVEGFAPGCDKGVAIQHFCKHLNVSLEQCVAFGDSMNDAPMFRICPTSVSMSYAPEELVALSTYHAKEKLGVAEGIEYLFGNRKDV